MKFVFNRDFRVSHMGHTLVFKKDVPQYVPPICRGEVRMYGGVPAEGEEDDGLEVPRETKPEFSTPKDEPVGEDRTNRIMQAYEYLESENDPKKFGANGMPKLTPIFDLIHFRIDANERNQTWDQYKSEKHAAANPSNENSAAVADNDS